MRDPRRVFPDFTRKSEIDRVLEAADTHRVSRKEFLKLASAGAVAASAAPLLAACGGSSSGSSTAVSDKSGKMAFLIMTNQLQYDVELDAAAKQVAKQLGFSYAGLNGQLNAQLQLNQFQQQASSGTKAILVHSPDGSNIRQMATQAQSQQIYMTNIWGTLPWFTPYEVGDYWTMYAQPDEFRVHGDAARVMFKAMGGKGNIVNVTGVKGNTADIIRVAGLKDALKDFPNIKLLGSLSGNWNSEDSQKAMEGLLSRFPDIQGVVAQNDDEATGVIAALNAAGKKPGDDILVMGADGTNLAAQRIKDGTQLVTTANVPKYAGYMQIVRLFDVQHGWKPSPGERMLQWRSVILTKQNVDPYLARYVNGDKQPFNADLMSKVKHPDDWDPQFLTYPMDLDILWTDIPKPAGWKYPEAYQQARQSGEMEKVAKLYKDHYKADVLGPSPA
jgi:ABC-type sugar transport system substrate-binding protein